MCEKTFDGRKSPGTTSFHQIRKDLTAFNVNKATMTVDLGCPNSVLEIIEVDEKFKFGPSGPYTSSKKMKIPIGPVKKPLWVTVAIVDAKIPMLLGNNILKPHEAEIKLFSTGGGVLVLKDEEIALVEADAGHYTIRVSDLGKLCKMPACFECKHCDSKFSTEASLKNHKGNQREESVDRAGSFE